MDLSKLPCSNEFSSYTLIVACVGVGNVSQLTCDLLINTLSCKLTSNIDFNYIPAVVGLNPYYKSSDCLVNELMTSSQLYVNFDFRLLILQIRAPPYRGYRRKHIQELISVITSTKFNKIILLSSSFATVRKDADLVASQLRYATSSDPNSVDHKQIRELGWLPLTINDKEEYQLTKCLYHLPGCGIATQLFESLCKLPEISVYLLNFFTSEGDNSQDAFCLVRSLDNWLRFSKSLKANNIISWSPPISWNMLFGTDAAPSLY